MSMALVCDNESTQKLVIAMRHLSYCGNSFFNAGLTFICVNFLNLQEHLYLYLVKHYIVVSFSMRADVKSRQYLGAKLVNKLK